MKLLCFICIALLGATMAADVHVLDFDDDDDNGNNTTTGTMPTTTGELPTTAAPGNMSGTPFYNSTCLMLKASISVQFKVHNMNMTSVVKDAVYDANCTNTTAQLQLLWLDKKLNLKLTLEVNQTKDGKDFQLSMVEFSYQNKTYHNSSQVNIAEFTTQLDQSYMCAAGKSVTVNDDVEVTFMDFQMEAFSDKDDTGFSQTVNDCKSKTNPTDTIVPIAVGCALAAMVLIVLIGYFIGRRRTREGYHQMSS